MRGGCGRGGKPGRGGRREEGGRESRVGRTREVREEQGWQHGETTRTCELRGRGVRYSTNTGLKLRKSLISHEGKDVPRKETEEHNASKLKG